MHWENILRRFSWQGRGRLVIYSSQSITIMFDIKFDITHLREVFWFSDLYNF